MAFDRWNDDGIRRVAMPCVTKLGAIVKAKRNGVYNGIG